MLAETSPVMVKPRVDTRLGEQVEDRAAHAGPVDDQGATIPIERWAAQQPNHRLHELRIGRAQWRALQVDQVVQRARRFPLHGRYPVPAACLCLCRLRALDDRDRRGVADAAPYVVVPEQLRGRFPKVETYSRL